MRFGQNVLRAAFVLLVASVPTVPSQAADTTPKQPEFVKKATWQESLVANWEALAEWERACDELELPKSDFKFGPWHLLGPVTNGGQVMNSVWNATKIEFNARYQEKGRSEVAWQKRDDLKDGQIQDLTGLAGAGAGDVVFLCRNISLAKPANGSNMNTQVTADRAQAVLLPQRHGRTVTSPLTITQRSDEMQNHAGEFQFLLAVSAGQDGKRRFYFMPQPNNQNRAAGHNNTRVGRRNQLVDQALKAFTSPVEQAELHQVVADLIWRCQPNQLEGWLPGHSDEFLRPRYEQAIARRLAELKKEIEKPSGVRGMVLADSKDRLAAWLERFQKNARPELTVAQLTDRYRELTTIRETLAVLARVRSLQLAVEDQRDTFKGRYPKAGEYLARINALKQTASGVWAAAMTSPAATTAAALVALRDDCDRASNEILLANPLMDFDKLLVVRGNPYFQSNWDGPCHLGSDLVVVSPVRADGQITVLHHAGRISDFDLNWDGRRVLFSDGTALHEINVDGTGLRQVSAKDPPVTHYDGCYLPNGQIVCVSNACEQAVPCTGGANVGNLHLMNADGTGERRIGYEQDQDWNPTMMQDGRVLYSRWEYEDTPHYFTRLLFRMNPDGTGQMEYYGSNSYWPNSMFWPRPLPGHPTEVVCIVSGHHGVSRVGELLVLDPAKGRHEADGVVQRIPGYGQKVGPVIMDQLVSHVWPRFAAPWPLAEPKTNAGAGKYFLVSVKHDDSASWDLCLVDIFDNITPILTGGFCNGVPIRPREKPPVIPSQVNPNQTDGIVYLADIYKGDGLRGYPRGSIKQLRIGSYEYRFAGNGDTYAASMEGGWDVRKILGTVPVQEDGSALFRVPANTPIFVQPLDADGKAQQIMRSWYTAMPGETASCVGCHERQNSGPPSKYTEAARHKPVAITPWNGPMRGFSFDRELQPVLDRRCVGCHDGKPAKVAGQPVATPDFRAKQLLPDYTGNYSPAYLALQKYVRRPGFESDYHMHVPSEFEADTSPVVQLLKKGHYNVQLTRDEWERLYTWIDFNVPYPVNWRESHRPPPKELVERRAKHQKLYANIEDHDEDPVPGVPVAVFEPPAPGSQPPKDPIKTAGWPLSADEATKLQATVAKTAAPKEIELPGGAKMKLVPIPAGRFVMGDLRGAPNEWPETAVTIDRPFYLGQTEVSNAQYAAFDPKHDSAYVEGRAKDRTTRGTPINAPDQPVVRISWNEAMAFCRWMSQETGLRVTLPTEAQWEWACRAGTATAFSFGDTLANHYGAMNIADGSINGWNHGRAEPNYGDGVQFTAPVGRFPANPWGLCDMHGNVAEWCLSNYRSYPYNPQDGRDDPNVFGPKVVRGGSWNDVARDATSSARWRYQPHQPVFNVGFRVVVEVGAETVVKTAAK